MIAHRTRQLLLAYAAEYETADFLNGDPSWFMHQVNGQQNQESMALLASILSFGSRTQFMPKIQWLLDRSQGDVDYWIRSGSFARDLPPSSPQCFYRLFTVERMNQFLEAYRHLLLQHGSMSQYIERNAHTGIDALAAICSFFSQNGISVVVPKDTHSACKRLCMFLRWMVRDQSPVDLGLWSHIIDKRTLIMPLDTHVLSQALRLGLMSSRSATLSSAIQLTKTYANKGAMTKYVNRQDAQDDADITKTDSTRIYIIKGEESRCSISVNIPSRMVNITYTDNRMWIKPSLWERIVNFVCNPFDNIWSLAMWAVILGLGYLVYKRYQTQITAAIEEAQNNNEE